MALPVAGSITRKPPLPEISILSRPVVRPTRRIWLRRRDETRGTAAGAAGTELAADEGDGAARREEAGGFTFRRRATGTLEPAPIAGGLANLPAGATRGGPWTRPWVAAEGGGTWTRRPGATGGSTWRRPLPGAADAGP